MISYYPQYSSLLKLKDSYFPSSGGKNLYIYVDIQNVCKPLYLEAYINDVYSNIINTSTMDISTFTSFINYIIRLRKFFITNMKFKSVKFIFFMDKGTSIYHRRLLKTYKENRKVLQTTIDPKVLDGFYSNLKLNYTLLDKILNTLHDVYFIKLHNLESDFIPHYLIKYKFTNPSDYHIIMSTDKDMLQTLNIRDNVYQYIKNTSAKNPHVLLNKHGIINFILKNTKDNHQSKFSWIVLLMSMVGDSADDIPGIHRVGYITALKYITSLTEKLGYSISDLVDLILSKEQIINITTKASDVTKAVKIFNSNLDIMNISYRLISYDSLIDFLEIITGKKDDSYKFNYGLISEYNSSFYNYVDTVLDDTAHKCPFKFQEFVDILKSIKGSVVWDTANIHISELQEYFNIFNTL